MFSHSESSTQPLWLPVSKLGLFEASLSSACNHIKRWFNISKAKKNSVLEIFVSKDIFSRVFQMTGCEFH